MIFRDFKKHFVAFFQKLAIRAILERFVFQQQYVVKFVSSAFVRLFVPKFIFLLIFISNSLIIVSSELLIRLARKDLNRRFIENGISFCGLLVSYLRRAEL